ncbi:P-loop containing nucleoside triphosphate hydrolase protein [Immersiella caudata]|uniref:P-loop containing nucleoside triphosphate hydrolase protein n=1 Tax=Immersiella caudata TaxID=314043 RepID=A0AA39WEP4_9PEZI|nr:P-loop containing nucleoside triphosphate hydrolase protein [Immersiella caudata]
MDNAEKPPSGGETGEICEVKRLKRIYKEKEFLTTEDNDTESNTETAKNKGHSAFALVSTQNFDTNNNPTNVTLAINSRHILETLARVVKYYPPLDLRFEQPIELKSPFELLYHHRKELSDEAAKSVDDASVHLNLLLAYLEQQPWAQAEKLIEGGTPVITFDLLGYIFKPGELLYSRMDDEDRLYWLTRANSESERFTLSGTSRNYLQLACAFHCHDGETIGKTTTQLKIWEDREFSGNGPKSIRDLSIFPLKFHPNPEYLKFQLRERGQKYTELANSPGGVYRYDGLCMRLKTPPDGSYFTEKQSYTGAWLPQMVAGRIVLDCRTFMEDHPTHRFKVSNWTFVRDRIIDGPEDYLILCPPFFYGYYLDMRSWCKFSIEKLKTPDWKPDQFDSLLLPENYPQTIQSLVKHHKYAKNARDEGSLKGKGLVFVLHGPPGTGKTRTAEAISEMTKKPLLLFPTGELGSELPEIQTQLRRVVRYATSWNAILLIDEADVFLESREPASRVSLQHNALVTIFLRQLEYFQGIIFLTSNRAQTFDAAVMSRIHMMLHYPSPDKSMRKKLWEQKLGDLKRNSTLEFHGEPDQAAEILSKYEMNGRDILNTLNSARTMARNDAHTIGVKDLVVLADFWKTSQPSRAAEDLGPIDGGVALFSKRLSAVAQRLVGELGIPLWILKMIGMLALVTYGLRQKSFLGLLFRLTRGGSRWLGPRSSGSL